MRKWICFGLSAVSIAYLLYIMVFQQHDATLKLDWFLLGIVGIVAALTLSGVGFMDLVKPKLITSVPCSDNDKEEPFADLNGDDEDQLLDSDKDVDNEEDNEEKVMESTILSWFYSQLSEFTEDEQNAIKECAILFVHDGTITEPSVEIKQNTQYRQERLYEICSAFVLLGIDRGKIADFLKKVFNEEFKRTESDTAKKRLKGKDKMQLLIDSYQEA